MIRRFGQLSKLKPEMVEEYDRLHVAVWPDVLKIIRECNIHNYSIYRRNDELFTYYEYTGEDYEADMKKMEADPASQKWGTLTHPCFVKTEKNEFYWGMKEVFHTD
jgi:L-rhamnose mutarotase